ncbi:MAG TPA: sterol desaturase family protein, partial [Candidatus Binataceae bacterium]|nr:sterol desaturase family protein [Candidatus Binataceae bacterium]
MLASAIIFASGLFAWTLLEYVIHGVLAHRLHTFAAPLHAVHHRDPHAVFAIRSWIPAGVVWLAALAICGLTAGTLFLSGLLAGFAAYETIHYRLHFCRPSCAVEARLRARHLAHHLHEPGRIFGVTNSLWDRVFGTEPEAARLAD